MRKTCCGPLARDAEVLHIYIGPSLPSRSSRNMDAASLSSEIELPSEKLPTYTAQPADSPPEPTFRNNTFQGPQPRQYVQQQHVQHIPQQHPQIVPQQYVQASFLNATPLSALNMGSAPVDCPMCGVRAMTRINFVPGSQTQYHRFAIL